MAKSKKKAAKKKDAPAKVRTRKQARLPGMEDSGIPAIETAAESYVAARDKRMALTKIEKAEKDNLLSTLHAHDKKSYRHGEIEIEILPEGEKLKVKIHAGDAEEEEAELEASGS